jgi:hypothetical protein
MLVITHPDSDRYARLTAVFGGIEVGHVYTVGEAALD